MKSMAARNIIVKRKVSGGRRIRFPSDILFYDWHYIQSGDKTL